ncbi:MAG: ADP-ribosylglycohydrolase family protein [Candidatus Nanopelagicales bacterium]
MQNERYANTLIGLAAGDAWGYQVEFTKYDRMPSYPVAPPSQEWRISDDTQMTLALDRAISECANFADISSVTKTIIKHFQAWKSDPDNNRAPGNACMGSLANLRRRGVHWYDSKNGARESAGCGAVMRLAPTAFAPDAYWAGLTALQAVVTHRHPKAVVSALILGDALREAATRGGAFLDHAIAATDQLRAGTHPWGTDIYLADVLYPVTGDVAAYLVEGLDEGLQAALNRAVDDRDALRTFDPAEYGDPCVIVGEGWDAATATALALLIADMATAPNDEVPPLSPYEALAWAATSNGDSDSIASMVGAVLGATSDAPAYWTQSAVHPTFEPRYAQELATAAGRP